MPKYRVFFVHQVMAFAVLGKDEKVKKHSTVFSSVFHKIVCSMSFSASALYNFLYHFTILWQPSSTLPPEHVLWKCSLQSLQGYLALNVCDIRGWFGVQRFDCVEHLNIVQCETEPGTVLRCMRYKPRQHYCIYVNNQSLKLYNL